MTGADPISLWDRSAEEPALPPADGKLDVTDVDVAIVGGGFTGLSTALHAAGKGLECLVLEAQQIGHGGSGRNAGLLNAGLWLPPQDVRAEMGERRGAKLVGLLGDAPAYVFSLIEQHQIRCEATRTGTIHAAHAASGLKDLERRAAEWQRLGAPVELIDRAQVAEKTGSDAFFGGLLDQRAGTINPMGYVRGLARVAANAGARIVTGVAVTGLNRDGGKWRVTTSEGTVSARRVVLATNAYTDALWPGLNRTYSIIHYFQMATPPLGDRIGHILPGRQGLWDTAPIMTSLRRDAHDRLIIGSMGRVFGGTRGLSRRWAAKRLAKLFPGLGPVAFETAWHGQIAMTPDHLPRILRLDDGLYSPIAYNGRGIAPGTVFGRAMADLLAGGAEDDLPMPVTAPAPVPRAALTTRFHDAVFTANQFLKSL